MLFSIIIPVYNVEEYLTTCLDSVLAQTFRDYEVILVDDGSTDGSSQICDKYACAYSNIRAFHKENGGLSSARNFGIAKARGAYILFLDSDDWWRGKDFLYKLKHYISKYSDPDIVYFNMTRFSSEGNQKLSDLNYSEKLKEYYDGNSFINVILSHIPIFEWYSVSYAYNLDFWRMNDFTFPKGRLYEDSLTTYKVLLSAKDVCVMNESFYCYRFNASSITGNASLKNLIGHLDMCTSVIKDLDTLDLDTKIKKMLEHNFASSYYAVLIDSNKLNKQDKKQVLAQLKAKSWIMNYTYKGKQKVCKYLIYVFGGFWYRYHIFNFKL